MLDQESRDKIRIRFKRSGSVEELVKEIRKAEEQFGDTSAFSHSESLIAKIYANAASNLWGLWSGEVKMTFNASVDGRVTGEIIEDPHSPLHIPEDLLKKTAFAIAFVNARPYHSATRIPTYYGLNEIVPELLRKEWNALNAKK